MLSAALLFIVVVVSAVRCVFLFFKREGRKKMKFCWVGKGQALLQVLACVSVCKCA
jgi:hypothetical protein